MKYISKPTVIEAEQYTDNHTPKGVCFSINPVHGLKSPYVITIHLQTCYIELGDWVVMEPDGKHYYPIKDEIFKSKYSPYND